MRGLIPCGRAPRRARTASRAPALDVHLSYDLSMAIPRPKLNLLELALIAVLVAVLAFALGRYRTELRLRPFLSAGASDLQALAGRFGPARHSRYGEEWIIRDFFQDRRGGVFVDVGANHYRDESNTYYLETELGWSGVAIEPQEKFAADYARHRPRTTFMPLFVSDVSNREATLYVPKSDLVASSNKEFAATQNGASDVTSLRTTTTTLDDVLDRSGITSIDFLSMDIELAEPAALAGFSIERFRPGLACIEGHEEVRQQILDYFARHGYVMVGKYWLADSENLWFAPLDRAAK
jgi:FkbM family methyltransferase